MVSGKKINVPINGPLNQDEEFYISAPALSELLAKGEKIALIDVRSPDEHQMLRIEGAQLATRELVEQIFTSWPKETFLVVYDHLGRAGLDAAKALASRGFTRAKGLRGGIDAWSQEVDPLIPRY